MPNGCFFFVFLTLFAIIDCFHDFVARRVEGDTVDVLSEIMGGLFYWGPCLALMPVVIALVKRYPLILSNPLQSCCMRSPGCCLHI